MSQTQFALAGLGVALSMAVTLGCGNPVTSVHGTVTLDGQPLDGASIEFVPADGSTASASSRVNAGKYSLEMTPGEKRVLIIATKVVGTKPAYEGEPNSPTIEVTASLLPPRYNTASTLQADVKPGRNEGVDFALTTK